MDITTEDKRTVLVTGGSRGIGKSLVTKFAKLNYTVWFTYKSGQADA
jgi:NAD(P)-dependent dehydrogenase (short-subunit alcohol dehydrogenase family)